MNKALLLAILQEAVEEANGGEWPRHLREWRRVGRHFGHRIAWMDPALGMDAHAVGGVVYINNWRIRPLSERWHRLEHELRHEMIETACIYEGLPPIYYPPEWGDHHQLTKELEDRLVYGDEWGQP